MSGKEKSIEEQYVKVEQLEHILLRPDSYVGSIECELKRLWILNKEGTQLEEKEIDFVPAFYKIFDEIIVNAADNYQRNEKGQVMTALKVVIDQQAQMISVWNNGKGIPVAHHSKQKVYVPEMIFGQLLTSSNYDDKEQKVVGGRNGYGAKLTNIFSKKFIIECNDDIRGKYFKQEWRKNMFERTEPVISDVKKGGTFTCVTFYPDLSKFRMTEISDDICNLLKKRVYDMAGLFNNKVKVYLNGEQVKVKSFFDYINMFIPEIQDQYKVYDPSMTTDRWEILVTFSDGQFKQVSFVNAICTSRGGKHVDYVVDKIVDKMSDLIQKKYKDLDIKPHQIKQNLFIFMNSLIVNPTFDSQTKETLTTKSSMFGSVPELSDKFIKNILQTGIIEQIVSQARARQNAKLAKTLKGGKKQRITGIPKLEDANDAGTARSDTCTLILTEGDSAKALAMAGIEVVGRDSFGVFPLKGKLLNVREAPKKQIMENAEIQNICKIVGLDPSITNYENTKPLRYGSIMIMADQDSDGSHIKGLVINFIENFWPSLFRMGGFLKEFVTPIIKASKGNEVHSFFTIQDFKNFASTKGDSLKAYKVKYYKGLGTSTDLEAKEYFSNILKHEIQFKYTDDNDKEAIELGFSRKKIEERKLWLAAYNPNSFVDYNHKVLRYKDFIDQELIHFSNADNLRSIPSVCDGLKPGQRKILFACFKRNLKSEIKVAQLIGYIAEHSAYHHGEQSLASTIVGMAQTFVGSNNINLLLPIGQFGSRNQGGKEHASARYICTNLSKMTRALFPENDDHILNYLEDDNQMVEPEWYLPIIPLCLVNGCQGIGTGWSTDVPNYNHRELVEQIKAKLQGKQFTELTPWYKGYQGNIEINPKGGGFIAKGQFSVDYEEEIVTITELPIGKWTRDYKNFLEELVNPPKGDAEIEDIREYHKNNRVHFEIQVVKGKLAQWGDIEKKLKLSVPLATSNIVMFTKDYKLRRYGSTVEILEDFFNLRLEFYEKRKVYLVSKLQREVDILQNKMKFIKFVVDGTLEMRNVRRKGVMSRLQELGLTPMSKITKINSTKIRAFEDKRKENPDAESDEEDQKDNEEEQSQVDSGEIPLSEYNYLLSMPLFSLTEEKITALQKQVDDREEELSKLVKKHVTVMWVEDLDNFSELIDEVEEKEEKERSSGKGMAQNGRSKMPPKKRKNNNNNKTDGGDNKGKGSESDSKNVSEKKVQKKNPGGTGGGGTSGKQKNAGKTNDKKRDSFIGSSSEDESEDDYIEKTKKSSKVEGQENKSKVGNTKTVESKENITIKPAVTQPKPMKQLTLMEKLQKKFESQDTQQVKSDILATTKRRKEEEIKPDPKNLKKKKISKNEDDEDMDFDLDLDYLEPSSDIINEIKAGSSSERGLDGSKRRSLRSQQMKERKIYRIDSDSEEEGDDYNKKNKVIDDEEEEEEFNVSRLNKNKSKVKDDDDDYENDNDFEP